MMEEKLISKKIGDINNFKLDDVRKIEDEQDSKEGIFNQIMKLINKRKSIIFGPEKSKTAKFIAENYVDVYNIINIYQKDKSD
ncbi:MAG: hypothetical protein KGD63_07940 [Candidatus Lokiarchaeota archaeon]|nr:hypothetical protein [Candidatus Lokiarchaeota archaeon]